MNKKVLPPIYYQAVIGFILIQLIHKAVHEIPGVIYIGEIPPIIYAILTIIIYVIGIVMILIRRDKWSFLPGIVASIMLVIQPFFRLIMVLLNMKVDEQVWWYPIFPILQGSLILYFSWKARRELSANIKEYVARDKITSDANEF